MAVIFMNLLDKCIGYFQKVENRKENRKISHTMMTIVKPYHPTGTSVNSVFFMLALNSDFYINM